MPNAQLPRRDEGSDLGSEGEPSQPRRGKSDAQARVAEWIRIVLVAATAVFIVKSFVLESAKDSQAVLLALLLSLSIVLLAQKSEK